MLLQLKIIVANAVFTNNKESSILMYTLSIHLVYIKYTFSIHLRLTGDMFEIVGSEIPEVMSQCADLDSGKLNNFI